MRVNRFLIQWIFGSLLLVWMLVSTTAYDLFTANIIRIIGGIFIVIGTTGRIYTTIFIGGMKNSKVINFGSFSMMRNPLYFYSFIGFIGMTLLTAQLLLTFIVSMMFLITYHYTIKGEEKFLSEVFKNDYANYLSTVPRFFPNLGLYSCPESIQTNIKFVNLEIRRACSWYGIALVVLITQALHYYSVLPNLFLAF